MRYVLFSACFSLLLSVGPVLAESIEVDWAYSYEKRTLELAPNQRAVIEVHIQSFGDIVDGFRISLMRKSDEAILKTIVSDPMGVVKFLGVPSGQYSILFGVPKSRRGKTSASIGDVVITPFVPRKVEEDSITEGEPPSEK